MTGPTRLRLNKKIESQINQPGIVIEMQLTRGYETLNGFPL